MKFLSLNDEIEYSSKRFELKKQIEEMFISEGYKNIEPKILEDYEEFFAINKQIDKRSTVKVFNSNGKMSILRPDITTNLMSRLIPRWEKNIIIKLFYYSKIFKHKKSGIKEIRQMGIEYLGEKEIKADKAVINLAAKILNKYRDNFLLEIGSSEFLNGLLKEFNFNDIEYKNIIMHLYNKNSYELSKYTNKYGKNEASDTLNKILELQGTYREIKDKLKNLYINEQMKRGLKELFIIHKNLEEEKLSDYVLYDLSMVADLGYYAGVIFKGYYPDSNRELLKGGRYDSLTQKFGSRIPAIGFSVELDELVKVLYRKGEI